MADAPSPPVKKRRLRWPLLLLAIAIVAVITVQWIVPIAMEQRAIAAIRAECPDVRISFPLPPSSTWFLPGPILGASGGAAIGEVIGGSVRKATKLEATYVGPDIVREWTGHNISRIESIDGCADDLRPAASYLRWLQHVERIRLADAGDEDLAYIGQLTQLRELSLEGRIGITDAGLEHLLALNNLELLDLSGAQVTFDGIRQLRALRHLSYLRWDRQNLSDAQRDELEQIFPGCEVILF